MNRAFDSDELAPCECGSPTLTIQFLPDGNWVISCRCGRYWPVKELWWPTISFIGEREKK
jgi:hypothetical protein